MNRSTYKKVTATWVILLIMVFGYISFMGGRLFQTKRVNTVISSIAADYETELNNYQSIIEHHKSYEEKSEIEMMDLRTNQTVLQKTIGVLQGRVAGLQTQLEYPFQVPTNGYIGSFAGNYGGNMHGMRHLGVDMWTTLENNGQISTHKGNPVFSACSGQVDTIAAENGGVTIKCDEISAIFNVPDRNVYTHYSHLGNAITKDLYISVHPGQKVTKGQFIGYQGDLSSYFPEMRNVHLHFSVFGGLSETDKSKGAYNPCLYIGGDCMTRGAKFEI